MRHRVSIAVTILLLTLRPPFLAYGESYGDAHVQPDAKEIAILEDSKYFDLLLSRINDARKEIIICMYLFKTTGHSIDPADRIKDALIKAARRKVDVRVLLERDGEAGSSIDSENADTARRLSQGGIKVYFDSPEERTHVKVVVIDRRYTFIGSHNLTSSALQYNRELSLMIESEDLATKTIRYIEGIINRHLR